MYRTSQFPEATWPLLVALRMLEECADLIIPLPTKYILPQASFDCRINNINMN